MADFTFMGGIYRDVYLVTIDELHIDLEDFGSEGVYLKQKKVSSGLALIEAEVLLSNSRGKKTEAEIKVEFRTPEGKTAAIAAKKVKIREGKSRVTVPLSIENPILWNGKANPFLYRAVITLSEKGSELDRMEISAGLRSFRITPDTGFYLNGEHLRLKGVSRHQDRKDKGWALSKEDQIEDMELIKEIGANSIRLAHYQHNRYFYDLCDKEGMIVWAEIPYISITSETDKKGTNALSQLTELVKQNYNHPSIIFWGLQNEITIAGKVDGLEKIVRKLNRLAKKLDPFRLTAQAQVGHHPDGDRMNRITDCLGYNKYYGWYYDKAEDFAPWLDKFHKEQPGIPLGITEYGAEGIISYHNDSPKVNDYSEEYQTMYHEKVWKIFEARNFIWGTYVWNMFDFASDLRDEGGIKGMNNKGLVTHDRKLKKDAFYWYKSNWSTEPVLHIASKRYRQRTADAVDIKVYSNTGMPVLSAGAQSFKPSKKDAPLYIFTAIPLQAGKNTITAACGKYSDKAVFVKSDIPEASYVCTAESKPIGNVVNWFDDDGLQEGEVPPLEFPKGYFSVKDRISKILKSKEGEAVLRKYLSAMFDHPMFAMVKTMSLEKIAGFRPDDFPAALLYKINSELNKIKKR